MRHGVHLLGLTAFLIRIHCNAQINLISVVASLAHTTANWCHKLVRCLGRERLLIWTRRYAIPIVLTPEALSGVPGLIRQIGSICLADIAILIDGVVGSFFIKSSEMIVTIAMDMTATTYYVLR